MHNITLLRIKKNSYSQVKFNSEKNENHPPVAMQKGFPNTNRGKVNYFFFGPFDFCRLQIGKEPAHTFLEQTKAPSAV